MTRCVYCICSARLQILKAPLFFTTSRLLLGGNEVVNKRLKDQCSFEALVRQHHGTSHPFAFCLDSGPKKMTHTATCHALHAMQQVLVAMAASLFGVDRKQGHR